MNVDLAPWEYEWAAHVGIQRMTRRTNSQNASHYQQSTRLEPELRATIATCCCEIAVARAYNLYWGGHVWDARDHAKHKSIADVGHNTEVRRVRKEGSPFAVRKADVQAGRLMVAAFAHDPDFRTITVYGSISADEAWELGEPSDFDPDGTRYCSISYLEPHEVWHRFPKTEQ